jgi:hypothetical protein
LRYTDPLTSYFGCCCRVVLTWWLPRVNFQLTLPHNFPLSRYLSPLTLPHQHQLSTIFFPHPSPPSTIRHPRLSSLKVLYISQWVVSNGATIAPISLQSTWTSMLSTRPSFNSSGHRRSYHRYRCRPDPFRGPRTAGRCRLRRCRAHCR